MSSEIQSAKQPTVTSSLNSPIPGDDAGHSPDSVDIADHTDSAGIIAHFDRWRLALQALFDKLVRSRQTPSSLVSLTLHALILLLLALIGVPASLENRGDVPGVLSLKQADTQSMDAELQLSEDSTPAPPQPEAIPTESFQKMAAVESTERLQFVPQLEQGTTAVTTQMVNPVLEKLHSVNHQNLVVRLTDTGVEGRRAKNRTELAIQRGGSLESERAVEAALEWLAAHQFPDGRWSLLHDRGDCNGRCANPGSADRFDTAATGLALLSFLGGGYTHLDGKYQQTVRRGIYYLRQVVEETPRGSHFLHRCDRGMYNHGIVAFALCEAYQMTQDPDLKELCQKTIDFTAYAQSYQGGWGYQPKQPGDLTISGWQMMALKSATAAGLEVSPTPIFKAGHFLNSQMADDKVNYFYRVPQDRSVTCTAIGILFRLFLGSSWTDPNIMKGLQVVANHNDYGNDIYYRYYATLLLYHVGGPLWEEWNKRCRDYLITTQSKKGHEAGSWYFEDHFGREGGRLYTTAMAAMTLEVYYRFSPLYQQTGRPFEL